MKMLLGCLAVFAISCTKPQDKVIDSAMHIDTVTRTDTVVKHDTVRIKKLITLPGVDKPIVSQPPRPVVHDTIRVPELSAAQKLEYVNKAAYDECNAQRAEAVFSLREYIDGEKKRLASRTP